jgi:hypothetical protein
MSQFEVLEPPLGGSHGRCELMTDLAIGSFLLRYNLLNTKCSSEPVAVLTFAVVLMYTYIYFFMYFTYSKKKKSSGAMALVVPSNAPEPWGRDHLGLLEMIQAGILKIPEHCVGITSVQWEFSKQHTLVYRTERAFKGNVRAIF